MPVFCGLFRQVAEAADRGPAPWLFPAGARGLEGFGVVFGKRGRDRKRPRFQIIDATPGLDPPGGLIFPLGVEGEADHQIAAVGPMLSHPRVIVLEPLDQDSLNMIERIPFLRIAVQLF
jgi:hypothetical protein